MICFSQFVSEKIEDPCRVTLAPSKKLESALPFHTSTTNCGSRRSGSGRNRGHGGSGKKGTFDEQPRCPSCNSPFTDVDKFKGKLVKRLEQFS